MLSISKFLTLSLLALSTTLTTEIYAQVSPQELEIEQSLKQNIEQARLQKVDSSIARSLNALADFYGKYPSKLNQAEMLYNQSLRIQSTIANLADSDKVWVLLGLANVQCKKHKYLAAERNLQKALAIALAPHKVSVITNDFRDTNLILNKIVVNSNNAYSMFDIARILNSLADLHFARRNIGDARLLYEKALQIYDCPDNADMMRITTNACLWPTDTIAKTLTNLSHIYAREGKFEQAQRRRKQAADVTKILGVP